MSGYNILTWQVGLSVYGYLCTRSGICNSLVGTCATDTVRIQAKLELSLWHESDHLNFSSR